LELEHQALGFLSADSTDRAQGRQISRLNAPNSAFGAEGGEQAKGELGPEPTGREQVAKNLALPRAIEAVQSPAVLLYHQLGEETDPRAFGGQSLSHADRHAHGIADASIGLHHE
jgi:hypothetical protein